MLLNNAEVNNDVSATGVSSFTPDDISYRVQIGYYDDDPTHRRPNDSHPKAS